MIVGDSVVSLAISYLVIVGADVPPTTNRLEMHQVTAYVPVNRRLNHIAIITNDVILDMFIRATEQ